MGFKQRQIHNENSGFISIHHFQAESRKEGEKERGEEGEKGREGEREGKRLLHVPFCYPLRVLQSHFLPVWSLFLCPRTLVLMNADTPSSSVKGHRKSQPCEALQGQMGNRRAKDAGDLSWSQTWIKNKPHRHS